MEAPKQARMWKPEDISPYDFKDDLPVNSSYVMDDENDDELIVKYKIYDTNNLFKKTKKIIKVTNGNETTNSALIEYKESFFTKIFSKLQRFFSKK